MELAIKKISSIIGSIDCSADNLFNGKLGHAMYYQSLAKVYNKKYMSQAEDILINIFQSFNEGNSTLIEYPYSHGLVGLGWVTNFFKQEGVFDVDLDELLEPLDEMFYKCASLEVEKGKVDFLHQALGVLNYFNTRMPDEKAKYYLEKLTKKVIKNGINDELGFRYISSIGRHSDKGYDMGIAHGLPGLLLILCEIHDKGIMQNAIKKVLYDGAKFILNFKRNQKLIKDKKEHSLYPSFINLKLKPNYSNRLAWCYGDIGILFLLHRLHLTLNDDLFLKEAEELAELVCQRKSKKGNLIEESQFCHGTAGLAQMFLRLYQLTNIKKYKKLYDFWIKETLKLLDKEFETGTYDGREGEVLEGYVGVGLVLLSYYSKESLFWDRMFLLS